MQDKTLKIYAELLADSFFFEWKDWAGVSFEDADEWLGQHTIAISDADYGELRGLFLAKLILRGIFRLRRQSPGNGPASSQGR